MLLDYRKDIDGLRAIAVLLVVLFHVGFPISGGFVGVDIFFVISGFLIASLIQKQILRDKFSFKGFYLHRMRRILPALITVIVTTFIAGWFLLMPEEYHFFISSIIYSLLGFSNIYFFGKGQEYFSADTDTIQLLHTWSLGVEEQFYFIAPIFLILLFKFTYKTKWFNLILCSLLLIGVSLSHYFAVTDKSYAYYLLPARFFELLMGVILALNYTK
ncbi:MAG TPA: acyltransferase, partial [Alphaproteobacteria bacterium]|nr:acyltransferase [Alphaproteobacteria bacterium]